MGIISSILGPLFSLIIVGIFLFWILARILGMTFWDLFNTTFDSIFGSTDRVEININTNGKSIKDIMSKKDYSRAQLKYRFNKLTKKMKGG